MKKIVASVGLVALGASGLQAVDQTAALNSESPRPWSISASLRGFYDDNINSSPVKVQSWGFEVSPSAIASWHLEQSTITLAYVYSYKYYEKKINSTDHTDQSHIFNASFDHSFSERTKLTINESFVIGQEPDLLRAGNAFATYTRMPGDNVRNFGSIVVEHQLTPVVGLEAGYANAFYKYADRTVTVDASGGPNNGDFVASTAGVLNRLEHTAHLDSRWTIQPETIGVFGYQFKEVDFTADQPIAGGVTTPIPVMSSDRNFRTHYLYVGADHTFVPTLTGSVRVGGSYSDYYNDPSGSSTFSPYGQASLRWAFQPESFAEVGVSHDRNATDLVGLIAGSSNFTLDSETTLVYATVNHRFTQISPKLLGTLTAQYSDAVYSGGAFNDQADRFLLVGLTFNYKFTDNFAAQLGYDFDKLDSDIVGRSFDRNRVFLGITASY
jgi:Putative beta-barrel porin 2